MKRGDWARIRGLDDALKKHLKAGLSASETAALLNKKFKLSLSKEAVVGRATRTGVPFSQSNGRARKMQVEVERKSHTRGGNPRLVYSSGAALPKPRLHQGEPKARGDVDDGCRYMHGESSDRNFCGAPKVENTSWCLHHYMRIYERVPPSIAKNLFVNC
jgi:hypothetical protein